MKLSLIISELVGLFEGSHYKRSTIDQYRWAWEKVRKFLLAEFNDEEFDIKRGELYLQKCYGVTAGQPLLNRSTYVVKTVQLVKMLETWLLYGVPKKREVSRKKRYAELKGEFEELYARYDEAIAKMTLSDVTRRHYRIIAQKFLNFVAKQGLEDPKALQLSHCHLYLRSLCGLCPKTVQQIVCGMRHLLRFMISENLLERDFVHGIRSPRISRSATLPSVWSEDEIKRLLGAVDLAQPSGSRDYAMMLLGCILGVRGVDVRNLKFRDFDWKAKKLRFVQHKTGRAIELPLPKEVGWAVIDYVGKGRPSPVPTDTVFLTQRPPFESMIASGDLSKRMEGYVLKAGIKRDGKKGFHSLRHTAASHYLEMGTPLPIITEILGHASPNTTALYLKEDVSKLAECVLEPEEFTDGK